MTNVVKTYFDGRGADWVESSYPSGRSAGVAVDRLAVARNIVEAMAPASLLDVGCGDGRFLRSMPSVERRVGLDYSTEMLDLSRRSDAGIDVREFDFGSEDDLTALPNLGSFQAVTMMGVLHYLADPLRSLSALASVCDENGRLLVSARNRLFNILPASQYSDSPLTRNHYSDLVGEARFWSQYASSREAVDQTILDDERLAPLCRKIADEQRFMGVTDPAWNPDGFENWRQFSPVEAIVLLREAGLSCVGAYPLHLKLMPLGMLDEVVSNAEMLPYCTSFLLVARLS